MITRQSCKTSDVLICSPPFRRSGDKKRPLSKARGTNRLPLIGSAVVILPNQSKPVNLCRDKRPAPRRGPGGGGASKGGTQNAGWRPGGGGGGRPILRHNQKNTSRRPPPAGGALFLSYWAREALDEGRLDPAALSFFLLYFFIFCGIIPENGNDTQKGIHYGT